jgi:hypothetical protein
MVVGVTDVAGATGRFVYPVNDWPYDAWIDDCPPPHPRRWPSVWPPPSPRVVVPDPLPCTPRFGVNTNWSDNRCAKLNVSVAQAGPAEPAAQPAPAPHCALNLGVNRNWLDSRCAKLYGDSTAQAGPAPPTTPPASTPRCVLNLGIDRDWLDSNCARLPNSAAQPGQAAGLDRLRDMFSSVVHPADWQAHRPIVVKVGLAAAVAVALVIIALLCAGLVRWTIERRARRMRRQENNRLSLLSPEPLAASARTGSAPFDPRARQARELADRANELQNALFGQP